MWSGRIGNGKPRSEFKKMARAYIAIALLIAFGMSFVSGPVFGQRRQTQQHIRISKETTWLDRSAHCKYTP